jgi:hypothetical protein
MNAKHCDFDLHGVVGVRLLDAGPAERAKVARQLGLRATTLDRDPDVVIRFVDVATHEPLTYVGVGDSGFNRDGFFLLRGRGGSPGRTRMPFADLGRTPEIVCERSVPAVPHLLSVINLVALTKGVLPLHASAFLVDGLGVMVLGWSKGGKTEALLAAMAQGASYVGDEWIYLTRDGVMHGLPEPIRVWQWQLDQFPGLLHARPRKDRARLSSWRAVSAAARVAARPGLPGAQLAGKVQPLASRQTYLQVPPAELFRTDRMALVGHLDVAILLLSHTSEEITTGVTGPTELAGRMAASLQEERATFLTHYRQFRYAFPQLSSPVLEGLDSVEAELLSASFDQRPCLKVCHPHPCDITALGEAVLEAADALAGRPARHPSAAS